MTIRLLLGCMTFLMVVVLFGQQPQTRFAKLDTDDGLPHNFVLDILEDSDGLVWISTARGLSQYNGFRIRNATPHITDSVSTAKHLPFIWRIYETPDRQMWLGAANGLFQFDRATGIATRFAGIKKGYPAPADSDVHDIRLTASGELCLSVPKGILCMNLRDSTSRLAQHPAYSSHAVLVQDGRGDIWSGQMGGLYYYGKADTLVRFTIPTAAQAALHIYALLPAPEGFFWVGTDMGLYRFWPDRGTFERVAVSGFPKIEIYDFHADAAGMLYMATGTDGLLHWNPTTGQVLANYQVQMGADGLLDNQIYTLSSDRAGNLWLGTRAGVNILPRADDMATLLAFPGGKRNPANAILPRLATPDNHLWYAPLNYDDLIRWNRTTGQKDTATWQPALVKNDFYQLVEDAEGNVWYASPGQGLFKARAGTAHFVLVKDLVAFRQHGPRQMQRDSRQPHVFWMATHGGLCRFDTRSLAMSWHTPQTLDPKAANDIVWRLARHNDGSLWFFNSNKLCGFHPDSGWLGAFDVPGTHSKENMAFGYLASMAWLGDTLYLGTQQAFVQFDRKTGRFMYQAIDGDLPIGQINNLLVAENGTVWFTRKNELVCYRPKSGTFEHYPADGWCDGFDLMNARNLPSGELAFGTNCGLLVIDPQVRPRRARAPRVVLSDFLVRNQPRDFGVSPAYLQSVALDYGDDFFTIEYTALASTGGIATTYRYKLEGLHTDWIMAGKERSVTFANLRPGHYVFIAEAIGDEDASGAALRLPIHIRPAFWQTWWFRAWVVLMTAAAIYFIFRAWRNTQRLEAEKHIAEQNTRYKSKFLSSVSHEIRTPLNAILGINGLLMDTDLDGKQRHFTESIHLSCEKLLSIVNDLLDQAKIESGKFSFHPQPFHLRQLVGQIERLLAHKFAEKGVAFHIHFPDGAPAILVGDAVRLFQILMNLLGNALKFTTHGSVTLRITCDEAPAAASTFGFTVADTGIGIPHDRLGDVFKSFEQIESTLAHQTSEKGTGLGLSIAKELIEMQGGHISVDSVEGKGTTFYFNLPFALGEPVDAANPSDQPTPLPGQLRILIVDDTPINQFLATELLRKHLDNPHLDTAANGEIALQKIRTTPYDLVLMDVRMPVMDGLEATRRVRLEKDARLQALPVIGLTADATPEQERLCLSAGMNTCVHKPLEINILLEVLATLFIRDTHQK